MRAVAVTAPGGPDVLELRDVAAPSPGTHDVLVRVVASGVNRADLLQRRGLYPAPAGEPADIPGLEYSGVVEAVGERVRAWSPGDPVMGLVGGGAYAELVAAHERTVVRVPDGVPLPDAGAIPEVFMTAYDALFRQAGLAAGDTLLIHAVGSGVGTAAVQLARRAGARSLGTSRTPAKLAAAEDLGLDHALTGGTGWASQVMALTGGRGVDVILDLVGAPYLAENQGVLATNGRHMVVGVPGGSRAEIDLRALMGRRATLRGTVLRARPLEEKAALARAFERHVVGGFADGSLLPVLHATFAPEQAGEAHGTLERNENFGKVVIRWP